MPHQASDIDNISMVKEGHRLCEKAQLHELNQHFGDCIQNVRSTRGQPAQFDSAAQLNHIQRLEEEILDLRNMYDKEIQALHGQLEMTSYERARLELNNLQNSQMATEYLDRVTELNGLLLRKDEELRSQQLLLSQKERELEKKTDLTVSLSAKPDLGRSELEELHHRLQEVQFRYETEYSQRLQLQDEVSVLKHKLELQQAFHSQLLDSKMRLSNDQRHTGQVDEENQHLFDQVNELTAKITALESKLLHEESNNRGLIERLKQERLSDQRRIRALETRLEEMQDLLLVKMKELADSQEADTPLQTMPDSLKAVEDEEKDKFLQNQSHLNSEDNGAEGTTMDLPQRTSPDPTAFSSSQTACMSPKPGRPATSSGIQRSRQGKAMVGFKESEVPKRAVSVPPSLDLGKGSMGQGKDYFSSLFRELRKEAAHPSNSKSRSSTAQDYHNANSSAIGNIEIAEVDQSGLFVRLVNSSTELEEDIGGFILQQNVGGHPVAVYRFPPRTRMKADATVTLWSAAANVSHKPPEDFLWKEQNRFGTGPECTTIFCRPNGQAIAWYTPARWNVRLQQAWQEPVSDEEVQTRSHSALLYNDGKLAEKVDYDTARNLVDLPSTKHSRTQSNQREEEPSVLLKREKESPLALFPTRSPWVQSTNSPTHPAYAPPRPLSMGNDGSSLCRQARSQSTRPDPAAGYLYAGSSSGRNAASGRDCSIHSARSKRGPTRSAGPSLGGVMYLGHPTPFASPLQRYYANASYNIKLSSQATLSPSHLPSTRKTC
ncbi:lamin-B2-like isoform X2 [Polyodon spathula]|uniref:lamin-B2-like isoform X2 n=1 Tax=Polyodon spathula TaxID=7913 RepID=UPI001B7E685E|nr:lamin-B2-like isoform X2 [Polyodon spathula]